MKAKQTDDIFAAVRTAKSSTEFGTAISGLRDVLKRLEAEQADAEQRRDSAVLDGGDLPALRQRVIDIQAEVATVGATISIAEKRREAAVKREAETEIQDRRASVETRSTRVATLFKNFDAKLVEVREAHAELDRELTRLAADNDALEAMGRGDLRIRKGMIRDQNAPEPVALMVGLSANGRRVDELFRRLGMPGMAVRVEPRRSRLSGAGASSAISMSADGTAATQDALRRRRR